MFEDADSYDIFLNFEDVDVSTEMKQAAKSIEEAAKMMSRNVAQAGRAAAMGGGAGLGSLAGLGAGLAGGLRGIAGIGGLLGRTVGFGARAYLGAGNAILRGTLNAGWAATRPFSSFKGTPEQAMRFIGENWRTGAGVLGRGLGAAARVPGRLAREVARDPLVRQGVGAGYDRIVQFMKHNTKGP